MKKLILIMALPILLIAFNNCGQTGDLAVVDKIDLSGLTAGSTDKDAAANVDIIQKACAQIQYNQFKTVQVSFTNPEAQSCNFGKDGNLPRKNPGEDVNKTYFRGRIEQNYPIDVPENSVVCGMEFAFENLQMYYDDHFVMTFDDVILAGSYDYSPFMQKRLGMSVFDWTKIRGLDWPVDQAANPLERVYCEGDRGGASACSWPKTEEFGQMNIRMDESVFQKIIALSPQSKTHKFGLVTIGDDDEGDCRISPIKFSVKIRYIQKVN